VFKICKKCSESKPFSEFYNHFGPTGIPYGDCRECTKKCVSENRSLRRKQYSEYDQRRFKEPARKRDVRENMKRHRSNNPEKYKARTALNNAVRDKNIVRQPCEVCGSAKSQAHHHDYSKPLEVRWLCFKHHRELEHGQTVTAA